MDIYGMEEIEELEDENNQGKPSLEEVKKIVDSKRLKSTKSRTQSKTYTKEDRIKNLEIAREKKKNIIRKTAIEPKPITSTETKSNPKQIDYKSDIISPPSTSIMNNDIIINELKNLVMTQNEILEKLKKDIKPKKERKPKKDKIDTKTLDLTITDDEIKNIIEKKEIVGTKPLQQKQEEQSTKLKAFLDALMKK